MKALKFYKELKESEPSTSSRESNPQFSASTGWLTGFIKRHSFHNLKIKGEVASADEEAARKYPEKLAKIIKDGEYCAHQVFNADETGLFWKKMPTRTYIAKSEKTASGFKAAKDRVTLLLCSNASGDRMLKPLLVNRSLKPRALKGKDLNTLPVHWMANKKAWVTTAIFTEWFNKCFVPEVENYMNEMGLEFKILLILDNAPAIAEIKSQTLNACWKAAWPECVSKGNESNRAIVTLEIISIAKEIGGEGFDDFGEHDIEELLVDEALNDDDILESMVDITKDLETVDSEPEEDVTPLDEKLLREGLQLSGKLANFFIQNDNDVERALKFQRDLKFCMSGYRELYKELVPSQSFITDYLVKKKNH
ncbi:tigger transposable element-derived protein 1 [Trichonephila clavipes]|nr:tigger transposable element-derived protein 1 [Trichonephila clavipes]